MAKQTTLKDREYLLDRKTSPITYSILSKDTANNRLLYFDQEANNGRGAQRALRYARNQQSPFVDEQDGNAIIEPIVFEDGVLRVSKQNIMLQEFLSLHPGNTANGGGEFYEFDPEAVAAQNIEDLNKEVDALILAKTLDLNKMLAIGRVYLNGNVDTMSTAELKRDILLFAKNTPSEFLEAANDPELEVDNVASRAIAEEFVIVKSGKDIYYNLRDNKKKILTIPFGEKPVDSLSKWLFSDAGKEFYSYLQKEFEA
jgi:hypothetical protein